MGGRIRDYLPSDALEWWDGWSWSIVGPSTIDDEASVDIHLINRDGKMWAIKARILLCVL